MTQNVAHWNALFDLHRVVPCEVQKGVDWIQIVSVRQDPQSDNKILTTSNGNEMFSNELTDPVLVRAIGTKEPE